MNIMTRTNIYLPMTALLLAALAIPAATQTQVPFKGALQGTDQDGTLNFPILPVTTTGTGTGTHLGEFSFKEETGVNVTTGTATGSIHWIAANGDSIDTTFTASGGLTDAPPVCPGLGETFLKIREFHTIIGGTGRFAGAQGIFIVDRQASPVTFKTCGSFDGTITLPRAAH
jgi:hypothetical protein